jgi:DNA-directed RNA polymerase subunit L
LTRVRHYTRVRKIYTRQGIRSAMQVRLIEKNETSIKIAINGADSTIITPILDKLNHDKNVKFARYICNHPDLDDPMIYVETYKGSAAEALKKATDSISDYFAKVEQ